MFKKNISIIIPSYNRSQMLRRALHSVAAQTLQPDEVIVVDDGSTDDTAAMLDKEFPFVKQLYQNNCGVSAARNLGISNSNGDWLAFLDSDDVWLPEKLAVQWTELQQYRHMKICHTDEIWIRNGKRVNAMKKHCKKGGWIFRHCLPLCAISPSSIMMHRSVFADIGLFDENLPACEDYDLWLRMTAQFPVLFIEKPLLKKYAGHDDQLSRKYWGMDRFRIQALEKVLCEKYLPKKDRQAAKEMLIKKISIFLNGAIKRGNTDDIKRYQQLLDHYQS